MDARSRMILSGVLVGVSVILSLIVAVVLFEFMSSSAEAEIKEWKFGGAFAGFVATFLILTNGIWSFFRLFTQDEVGTLLRRVEELQLKVLKGAPVPRNYAPELDESNRISFVRPTAWADWNRNPLYIFKNPSTKGAFGTNFVVMLDNEEDVSSTYERFKLGKVNVNKINVEDLYENYFQLTINGVKGLGQDYQGATSKEYLFVNDQKSLRYTHTFSFAQEDGSRSPQIRQLGVLTWLKNRKCLLVFTFSDAEDNFVQSSEIFSTILASVRFW